MLILAFAVCFGVVAGGRLPDLGLSMPVWQRYRCVNDEADLFMAGVYAGSCAWIDRRSRRGCDQQAQAAKLLVSLSLFAVCVRIGPVRWLPLLPSSSWVVVQLLVVIKQLSPSLISI